ncbi:MAG TPA: adenylate kinase [Acidimicrobiales bacterium]|nr:adenylate kinase [Acidimicrobiales bacterium]
MRILLVAPPGAGKGTQAERIAQRYGITHISSGDILREEMAAGTPIGERVRSYVEHGDLVPDDVMLAVVGPRILEAARNGGYVLDGYPRTVVQARTARELAEEHGVTLDGVVALDVDEAELVRRMAGRARIEGRSDDADEEVVRHRLDVYNEKTRPLIDFYDGRGLLRRVDARGSVDDVSERLFAILDPLRDKVS